MNDEKNELKDAFEALKDPVTTNVISGARDGNTPLNSWITLRHKQAGAILAHIKVQRIALGQWEQTGRYLERQLKERDKHIAELEEQNAALDNHVTDLIKHAKETSAGHLDSLRMIEISTWLRGPNRDHNWKPSDNDINTILEAFDFCLKVKL